VKVQKAGPWCSRPSRARVVRSCTSRQNPVRAATIGHIYETLVAPVAIRPCRLWVPIGNIRDIFDQLVGPHQERGGTSTPIALAVLRLIASSNFVGGGSAWSKKRMLATSMVPIHAEQCPTRGPRLRLTSSYFSGLVATTLGRASRRSLHAATAVGGVISIRGKNSRNGA
jgi:hypothetical protein